LVSRPERKTQNESEKRLLMKILGAEAEGETGG